jgi:hypothetical protein
MPYLKSKKMSEYENGALITSEIFKITEYSHYIFIEKMNV